MFQNREDAACRLAARLRGRKLRDPIILAIPRGGVVLGAILARELRADLDVILARKLRHPEQLEVAIGAISETGELHLNRHGEAIADTQPEYLVEECRYQTAEITHRMDLFRTWCPPARLAGRSVVVTDDGIATGATMIAALKAVRAQHPAEVIVAVPIANPEELGDLATYCDEIICLEQPTYFRAVGQVYRDFAPVNEEEAVEIVRNFVPGAQVPHELPCGTVVQS